MDESTPEPITYTFGPFRLDAATLQLHRGTDIISLTPKGFDTLLVLLKHRTRVVSKEELFRAVWRDVVVSEDSLTQTISSLRRALGDDPNHSEYIATIPRRGYRFTAPVTEARTGSDAPATTAVAPMPPLSPVPAAPPPARSWRPLAAVAAVIAVVAVGVVVARSVGGRDEAAGNGNVLLLPLDVPEDATLVSGGVVSPDGRHVVFVALNRRLGETQLWLRTLDAAGSRPLPGTEGSLSPFWAPDSGAIGFFANGKIRVVEPGGDSARTVATMGGYTQTGGTWNGETILYSRWRSEIFAIPAGGGSERAVTTLDASAQEAGHSRPQFLPDGRRFLYHVASANPDRVGTYLGSLDAPDKFRLVGANAVYASPGYLLYVEDRVLMAHRFDAGSGRLTGSPAILSANVAPDADVSAAAGLLTFGGATTGRLVWMDRAGQTLETLDTPTVLHNPTLSPDGTQIAASANDELRGVWLIDQRSGAATRLVPNALTPAWSPDGRRLAYHLDTKGAADIYSGAIDDAADPRPLVQTREPKVVNDWSHAGIVYMTSSPQTKMDLWLLPPGDGAAPRPIAHTPFNEMHGQLSPDGRWLAYASDESGTLDVYVQSMAMPGLRRTVSIAGGATPQWRRDGRELYYLAPDRSLMVVAVTPGDAWQGARAQALFKAPVSRSLSAFRNQFAVTADGQRFVFDAGGNRDTLNLLVNWQARLRN